MADPSPATARRVRSSPALPRASARLLPLPWRAGTFDLVLTYLTDPTGAQATHDRCRAAGARVLLVQANVARAHDVERQSGGRWPSAGRWMCWSTMPASISIGRCMSSGGGLGSRRRRQHEGRVFVCAGGVAGDAPAADGGSIINIGASTGIRGRRNAINYCAAKAGVLVMTQCLALELAPTIRVNCVIPGLTDTDEVQQRFGLAESERRAEAEQAIPLGRMAPGGGG